VNKGNREGSKCSRCPSGVWRSRANLRQIIESTQLEHHCHEITKRRRRRRSRRRRRRRRSLTVRADSLMGKFTN